MHAPDDLAPRQAVSMHVGPTYPDLYQVAHMVALACEVMYAWK